jgi:cysteinyl-tRNA synthetase
MPLCLYNTLSRRKEVFQPLAPPRVNMYTCGPTVYGRPHIGNFASFLLADTLRRWLEVSGYDILHVKNITDVGHLLADADAGEDKVEREARRIARERRGESAPLTEEDVLAVARMYEEQYLEDERALQLLEPMARPRASETIPEMIALIESLLERGHAYEAEDGIYFSVQTFPSYGALSGNTLEKLTELEEGVRIDVRASKRHPADFALWKKRVGEHREHILHWDSPWGDGFPGWHIECSAMSTKFLGETFDIHTGGEDNIFPHHECEIAQSEGGLGHPVVRFWVHKRRLNFTRGVKMSKSIGNVLALPEIVERGYHPLDLRFFLLSSHYRSHTQFSWKGLQDAKSLRHRIIDWMEEVGAKTKKPESFTSALREIQHWQGEGGDHARRFKEALDDDLNTAAALAAVSDLITWSRSSQRPHVPNLQAFSIILEHTFGCFEREGLAIPSDVQALIDQREMARKQGDFTRSDALRREVRERGFVLEDTPKGTKITARSWRKGGGEVTASSQ